MGLLPIVTIFCGKDFGGLKPLLNVIVTREFISVGMDNA